MSRPPARRGARLLATAGLSLALLPASAASALSTSAGGHAPTRAVHAAHTVTLITGDKVTVTDLGVAGRPSPSSVPTTRRGPSTRRRRAAESPSYPTRPSPTSRRASSTPGCSMSPR